MSAIVFTPNRECGECYACCVYLGIDELHKWPTQTCKNLDGTDACKRCSIYDTRPSACALYVCAWRSGILDDEGRPDKSGLLISYYETAEKKPYATIIIIDIKKCTGEHKWLNASIQLLLQLGLSLQIVDFKTKKIMEFTEGNIYEGKILKGSAPEDLEYERSDKPVSTYTLKSLPTNVMQPTILEQMKN